MLRRIRNLSLLFTLGACSCVASAQGGGVWLEVPGADLHVANGEAAVLATPRVPVLRVHLRRQPDEVAYSRITTWVNAASANIVTSQNSNDEGIISTLDLARNPDLTLMPGRNSVEVTYRDRWNEMHYASFILQLPGGKTDKSIAGRSQNIYHAGRRFALIIGVGKYEFGGRGIQNIAYADQDAAAMRKELVSPRGGNVPEQNVEFLLNENAGADAIRGAVKRIMSAAAPEDTVLVYLNMNGSYDPSDPDRKYLLPYDTDPAQMKSTALSITSFVEMLSGEGMSKHVVVFADTCHGNVSGTDAPDKTSAINLVNLYLARALSLGGNAAAEASDIHQVSHGGAQWGGSGVFAHYIIEGMNGLADANRDGTVTTDELFRYVQIKVAEATMDEQLPMISAGHAGDVAIAGVSTAGKGR